jgi:hypothetical protein
MDRDRLNPSGERRQKNVDLLLRKTMHQAPLRTKKHVFVLQKKGRAGQEAQLPCRYKAQQRIRCAFSAM